MPHCVKDVEVCKVPYLSVLTPPSLLVPPPLQRLPLQSSYFRVLHPSQQPPPLRFQDSEKKMRFSTSPIEYHLREVKKVTTKQSNYDHKCNEIWKNMR